MQSSRQRRVPGHILQSRPRASRAKWTPEWAVKGRTAEAIVEELFRALGWHVYRFGWENTVPQTLADFRGGGNDVARRIRLQPDFVVYKPPNGAGPPRGPFYVEAKYRADGRFTLADLEENYPYPDAFFVVVTPRKIECITAQQLKDGLEVEPRGENFWFAKRPEFGADEETVFEIIRVANKMFEGDLNARLQTRARSRGFVRRASRLRQ